MKTWKLQIFSPVAAILAIFTIGFIGCQQSHGGGGGGSGSGGKTLTGIVITTQPTKTQYKLGETLNTAGMVITAVYNDGSTRAVTGYTVSGYKATVGNHTITVSYKGKTAEFTVNVIDPSLPTVVTPTVSPAAGTYNQAQNVTLTTTTKDAVIYYTTDGTDPTTSSASYTGVINIDVTTTLKAFAVKDGWNDSEILIIAYTINVFTSVPTLTLTARDTGLMYTWTASVPAADSYDIYWKQGNGLDVAAVKTGNKITGATSGGIINDLTNGLVYSVLVTTNKAGFNSVDSVEQTITPAPGVNAVQPTISVQPQGGTYARNQTLSTKAASTDGGTLRYQWYKNTANNTTGGTAISGATDSNYALSDLGTSYYYVIVTNTINDNGDGGAKTAMTTSSTANVTVEPVRAEWARSVSAGSNASVFNAVARDADGNVYAVGGQRGSDSFTYGTGVSAKGTYRYSSNAVLVKYNSSGTALWARSVSAGDGASVFNAVAVDTSGNVYAAGFQNGDETFTYGTGVSAAKGGDGSANNVVLVKYNSSGTALWARTVSTAYSTFCWSRFNAVAVDASGNVYAAGYQDGTRTFTYGTGVSAAGTFISNKDNNGHNVVLVKYDSNGTALWARSVSSGNNQSEFNAVAVDTSGNVYAAGYQDESGSYTYGTGVSAQGSYNAPSNVVLVKYDSNGTALWARSVNSGNNQSKFNAVAVDTSGNVYAAGYQNGSGSYTYGTGVSAQGAYSIGYNGGSNVVLIKYDSNGTALWARSVNSGNNQSEFNAVAVDVSGNVYAAGFQNESGSYTYGTGVSAQGAYSNGYNVVLVKYDTSGAAQWARSVNSGSSESRFYSVTVDYSGNVYTAGYQYGSRNYTYGTGVSAQGTNSSTATSFDSTITPRPGNVVLVKYRN